MIWGVTLREDDSVTTIKNSLYFNGSFRTVSILNGVTTTLKILDRDGAA